MNKRWKLWAAWVALAVVCVAIGVGGGVWNEARQTGQSAARVLEEELIDKPANFEGLSDSLRELEDPAKFQKFCEKVRQQNIAMGVRSSALSHREKRTDQDFDSKGESIAVEEVISKVWNDAGKEKRTIVRKSATGTIHRIGNPKYLYPLSKAAGLDAYECRFDGTEPVGDKLCVRIRFTPKEPVAGKLSGWLWVDPETGEPTKFEGLAVKPPAFVDRLKMTVQYASAENSANQIHRVRTEARIPILRRTRKIDVDFSDYRPQ